MKNSSKKKPPIPLKKEKKIDELQRLKKLFVTLQMNQWLNEERIERYKKLTVRNSQEDSEKKERNIRRLEIARQELEQTLVFLGQVKESLEKIGGL